MMLEDYLSKRSIPSWDRDEQERKVTSSLQSNNIWSCSLEGQTAYNISKKFERNTAVIPKTKSEMEFYQCLFE